MAKATANGSGGGGGGDAEHQQQQVGPNRRVRMRGLARVASVAAGVQFGWALQSSLLTPYVQELGIPHTFAGYIWLCGPISGMFVQPVAGYYSDHCTLKWGRRRPFILGGALSVIFAVLVISFSADIGALLGDHPSQTRKPYAIVLFILGFWLLDLANNTLQGPCRALLADLAGKDHRRTRRANAFFSLFLSVGNVLGYAAGAYSGWYKLFPFTKTSACDHACANLKSTFLIDVLLLIATTILSVTAAKETPWKPEVDSASPLLLNEEGSKTSDDEEVLKESDAFFWELLGTVRNLPRQMWCILLITSLTWVAWYPFWLFNTDWMGREVYKGIPNSSIPGFTAKYDRGVRIGSFGLMLNSVVLGVVSLGIEPLCRKFKPNNVWAISNMIMFFCFFGTVVISILMRSLDTPPMGMTVAAVSVFALLGAPLAVTYSIPFAMTARIASESGGGQGLSVGVLNLAVVIPQFIVSLASGPWDILFGGGNMPAFGLAAMVSLISSVMASYMLPRQPEIRKPGFRRTLSSPVP